MEVKLHVFPVSIDNSIKPFVTTHFPSGNQAKKDSGAIRHVMAYYSGYLTTLRSGPPTEGMTMKVARSLSSRTKPMEPSIRRKGRAGVFSQVRGQSSPVSVEPIDLT